MRHRWYILEWIYTGTLLIAGFCMLSPGVEECKDAICLIMGVIAFLYCTYNLVGWFACPIQRDWILVKGYFLSKVICFVMSVPFAITAFLMISEDGACCNPISPQFGACLKNDVKKEMIFAAGMFVDEKDTLKLSGMDSISNFQLSILAKLNGWVISKEDSIATTSSYKNPNPIDTLAEEPHLYWSVYSHFIDPGNQHMSSSDKGRGYAALVAIMGFFLLNGLLVASLIGWIDIRKEKWYNGEIRYGWWWFLRKRHAIVIGANEVASAVIKNLFSKRGGPKDINFKCEGNNSYVILQTCRDPHIVRDELAAHLPEELLKKVVIYKALRNSEDEIRKLYPCLATEIYVLGESVTNDGAEASHDALNMECVDLIAHILEKTREKRESLKTKLSHMRVKVVCKTMFEYQTTSSLFQFSDISKTVKENLVFIPFNRYESWARKVIVSGESLSGNIIGPRIKYMPLDGYDGIKEDSNQYVHFIVVGMSKMGVAMGIQAMLHAHYLNFARRKTRITFIDTNANEEMAYFKGRYSNLFELVRHRYLDCDEGRSHEIINNWESTWIDPIEAESSKWKHLCEDKSAKNFIDLEVEFVKGSIESDGVREFLLQATGYEDAKVTIAICLTQTHQAIAASLYMPTNVYKSRSLQEIWVYQSESSDIIANLGNNPDLRYKKLRPFGMLYGEYMNDRKQYLKAMLVNAAYGICYAEWPKDMRNTDGDNYRTISESWQQLTVDKKWSNKFFVDSMYQKIKNAMCNDNRQFEYGKLLEELNAGKREVIMTIKETLEKSRHLTSESEHNRWNVQQLLFGYSACMEQLDMVFQEKASGNIDKAKSLFAVWVRDNLATSVSQIGFNPKKVVKESELRIHPNICAFSHLDVVDQGAKPYDEILNEAIPSIIELVDIL